jgi:hypothetical protein
MDHDSIGNLYLIGNLTVNNNSSAIIIKYDSNGVYKWSSNLQHIKNNNIGNTSGTKIHVKSDSKIYVTGYSNTGIYTIPFVAECDDTGQWQLKREFMGDINSGYGMSSHGVSTDAAGKIYMAALNLGTTGTTGYIAILDPTNSNNITGTVSGNFQLLDGSLLISNAISLTDADAIALIDADATDLTSITDTTLTDTISDTTNISVSISERAHN